MALVFSSVPLLRPQPPLTLGLGCPGVGEQTWAWLASPALASMKGEASGEARRSYTCPDCGVRSKGSTCQKTAHFLGFFVSVFFQIAKAHWLKWKRIR